MPSEIAPEVLKGACEASLPAFTCPPGTKLHLLDLGTLECDEGW